MGWMTTFCECNLIVAYFSGEKSEKKSSSSSSTQHASPKVQASRTLHYSRHLRPPIDVVNRADALRAAAKQGILVWFILQGKRVAEWLRRLNRKPKVRTAVGSNPMLDSLVSVRNASPGRPVPCEGNLVAVASSCSRLMVKYPWPLLLEISLSGLPQASHVKYDYHLPT